MIIPKYTLEEVKKESLAIHGIYPCPHCSMSSYLFVESQAKGMRECLICKTIY